MSVDTEDVNCLMNHLSLGQDGKLSNPLNPIPPFLKKVDGIGRLRRFIESELPRRDKSNDLAHLLSLVRFIWPDPKINDEDNQGQTGAYNSILAKCPSAVLKNFFYSEGKTERLLVHIVSSSRDTWYKISTRNPKSIAIDVAGGGGYGKKSIVDQALDFLKCAQENRHLFKPPKIVFVFTSGISEQVASELEATGVEVIGRRIEDEELQHPRIKVLPESDIQLLQASGTTEMVKVEEVDDNDEDNDSAEVTLGYTNPNLVSVERLNLDVSTLLAYTSNLTNGHANVRFKCERLAAQADAERLRPQKPILDEIFTGRQLFCCETAMKVFQSTLSSGGGEEEKIRAAKFIAERVTVVPDQITKKAASLPVTGKIKLRCIVIFSTGEVIKAVTVTANSRFVRSARLHGVDFPSFVHEWRAMSEQTEMAKLMVDDSEVRFGYTNPNLDGVERLNLDVSTLSTYTSNLTNGHAHVRFKKKILSDQADAERLRPQKPILDEIFTGRQLFCCETAMKVFQSTLSAVGGEEEKSRAAKFIAERVTVVPDQITEKAASLSVTNKINQRSVAIFSTGEVIKAVTVTSNSSFVSLARSQGVDFPSFVHEWKWFSERNETSADHTV